MSIAAGSLELAHARIWARWGARADEASWRRIELTRDLAAVLDIARGGALAGWVEGVGIRAGPHAIERALRRHWRERVNELAHWMPGEWQPSIDWCGTWVDLALVHHLARGQAPPAWIGDDESLRPLVEPVPAAKAPPSVPWALRALLDAARADPQRLPRLWTAQWRARLPRRGGAAALEAQWLSLLEQHAAAFGAADAVDGWALRRALHARLVLLLRRALVEPLAAFVYLALNALEFERLRAELIGRAAFPHRQPAR